MKTKFFSAFIALMFVATLSQAQDYKSAVGLRFGAPLSVSYKTFVSDRGAFEGVAGGVRHRPAKRRYFTAHQVRAGQTAESGNPPQHARYWG